MVKIFNLTKFIMIKNHEEKKALIITGSMVQDHEFIYPFYRLKEEGIETAVFNGSKNQVLGFLGQKYLHKKTII